MEDINMTNSSWSYVEDKVVPGYQLDMFVKMYKINPEDPQFSREYLVKVIESLF